jgi:hypothetical protein
MLGSKPLTLMEPVMEIKYKKSRTGRRTKLKRTKFIVEQLILFFKATNSKIYILIGMGFSFELHNLLIFGQILQLEGSNSRYFHVVV